jgi:hypothetical protein
MLRTLLSVLALMTLASCGGVLASEEDQTLQTIVSDTRAGRVDAVYARLDTGLKTPQSQAALDQLTTMLRDAGEPCERSLIGVTAFNQWNTGNGSGRRIVAQHKYACPNATLRIDLTLWVGRSGEAYVIENFHVRPIDAAAAAQAADFSISGQTVRHYAFLAGAIGSVVLMLASLLGVILTKGFKRKWLWAVISFVGITKLSMVWPTGEIFTQFATINLIGFGITRAADPMAPWIVSFTPPVGALLVLSLLWPRWAGLNKGEELAGPRQ